MNGNIRIFSIKQSKFILFHFPTRFDPSRFSALFFIFLVFTFEKTFELALNLLWRFRKVHFSRSVQNLVLPDPTCTSFPTGDIRKINGCEVEHLNKYEQTCLYPFLYFWVISHIACIYFWLDVIHPTPHGNLLGIKSASTLSHVKSTFWKFWIFLTFNGLWDTDVPHCEFNGCG